MANDACHQIYVLAFRGRQSPQSEVEFQQKQRNEELGAMPAPTRTDCLLHAGHAGITFDEGGTIDGFNPHPPGLATREFFDALKRGECFGGVVLNDTSVFEAAVQAGIGD